MAIKGCRTGENVRHPFCKLPCIRKELLAVGSVDYPAFERSCQRQDL